MSAWGNHGKCWSRTGCNVLSRGRCHVSCVFSVAHHLLYSQYRMKHQQTVEQNIRFVNRSWTLDPYQPASTVVNHATREVIPAMIPPLYSDSHTKQTYSASIYYERTSSSIVEYFLFTYTRETSIILIKKQPGFKRLISASQNCLLKSAHPLYPCTRIKNVLQ